jgi:hypothetical protein
MGYFTLIRCGLTRAGEAGEPTFSCMPLTLVYSCTIFVTRVTTLRVGDSIVEYNEYLVIRQFR